MASAADPRGQRLAREPMLPTLVGNIFSFVSFHLLSFPFLSCPVVFFPFLSFSGSFSFSCWPVLSKSRRPLEPPATPLFPFLSQAILRSCSRMSFTWTEIPHDRIGTVLGEWEEDMRNSDQYWAWVRFYEYNDYSTYVWLVCPKFSNKLSKLSKAKQAEQS